MFVGRNSGGGSDLSCFYNTAFGVGGGGGVRASFQRLTDFWLVGGWLT